MERGVSAAPLQNRMTPFGDLIATPERGALMGNRGVLHDGGRRIVRRFSAERRWICCLTEFKGRRREVMAPGRYTEPSSWTGHRPRRGPPAVPRVPSRRRAALPRRPGPARRGLRDDPPRGSRPAARRRPPCGARRHAAMERARRRAAGRGDDRGGRRGASGGGRRLPSVVARGVRRAPAAARAGARPDAAHHRGCNRRRLRPALTCRGAGGSARRHDRDGAAEGAPAGGAPRQWARMTPTPHARVTEEGSELHAPADLGRPQRGRVDRVDRRTGGGRCRRDSRSRATPTARRG